MNASRIQEPVLHVVSAIPMHHISGWLVQGVFTKPEDAQAMKAGLHDDERFLTGSAFVETMPFAALKMQLFREQVDTLMPLLQRVLDFGQILSQKSGTPTEAGDQRGIEAANSAAQLQAQGAA